MALPETVVAQLGREAPQTPGWSLGIISFSGGILFIAIFLWAGLAFGYKPYLDGLSAQVQSQITTEGQQVTPTDQANLINFYSQLSNLQTLLSRRTTMSNAFAWLESNTEDNVFYTSMSLAQNNVLALNVQAKTTADADQQIAIFESSPDVQSLTVTSLSFQSDGYWQFNAQLSLDPSVFQAPSVDGTTATSSTQ